MFLYFFDRIPREQVVKKGLMVCFTLFFILIFSVNVAFEASHYPVSYMESQLSFSGKAIKSHYAQMTDDNIQVYQFAQGIDYAFLMCYGICIFFVGIYIGRYWLFPSHIRLGSYFMGIMGVVGACCDAVENAFIVAMAQNPSGFPDVFAIIQSVFALVKFVLLGSIFILFGVFIILIMFRKINKCFDNE